MNITYDYEIYVMQRHGGISRYFYEIITILLKRDDVKLTLFAGINNSSLKFSDYQERSYLYGKEIPYPNKINILLLPSIKYISRQSLLDITHTYCIKLTFLMLS